jgi:hypothetical protein
MVKVECNYHPLNGRPTPKPTNFLKIFYRHEFHGGTRRGKTGSADFLKLLLEIDMLPPRRAIFPDDAAPTELGFSAGG